MMRVSKETAQLGQFLTFVSGSTAIGAGAYLLVAHSAATITLQDGSTATSWFQVLARGAGIYFISRGVLIIASLMRSEHDPA